MQKHDHRRVPRSLIGWILLLIAGLVAPLLIGLLLTTACDPGVEPLSREPDHTPPVVVRTTPAADQQEVSALSSIMVAFDEAVDEGTVHHGSFGVSAGSQAIHGLVMNHGDARRFTFIPSTFLPANQLVEVEVRDVADLAGNPLIKPYRFSFQTGDPEPLPPAVPTDPYPGDGAIAAPIDTVLTWEGGPAAGGATGGGSAAADSVTYELWLGTDVANLSQRAAGLTEASFRPGLLPYQTTHVWQIIARSPGGQTTGPHWSFTTEGEPLPPNDPPTSPAAPITPANGTTAATADVELTWSGGDDPDEDPVTYLVRLGTSYPPPDLGRVGVRSLSLQGLGYEAHYFWQIVAEDDHEHRVEGPIWNFSTPDEPPPPNEPPSAPRQPSPGNGSEVPAAVTLSWNGGDDPDGDDVEFVVFLEANDLSDPDSVAVVYEKTYSTVLEYGTGYFWRIEARDGRGGVSSSPIWFFTTEEFNGAPSAPCSPIPANGTTNLWFGALTLEWGCGIDPEGDSVEFDLHFGTRPNPPYVGTTSSRAYQVDVAYARTYYWQVVARDNRGAAEAGPVWVFQTIGAVGSGSPDS